jgi:hypothetical protein
MRRLNSVDLSDTLSVAKKKFGYATEGISRRSTTEGGSPSGRYTASLAKLEPFAGYLFVLVFGVTNLRFVFVLKTVEKRFLRWWKGSLDLSIAKQYSRSYGVPVSRGVLSATIVSVRVCKRAK